MVGYIYMTTNLINGKKYIGKHVYRKYPKKDPKYLGSGKILKKAMTKYGLENFSCVILQWCKTKWELNAREKAWILMYNASDDDNFYNISRGGDGGGLPGERNYFYGHTFTEETKRKMSLRMKLRPKEKHPMYGTHRPKSTREKISKTLSGVPQDYNKGSKNGASKYTENQILEVVNLYKNGYPIDYICNHLDINQRYFTEKILGGLRWAWLTKGVLDG